MQRSRIYIDALAEYSFPTFENESHGFRGWPGTSYISEADLELLILLPLPPQCWDYKRAPTLPVKAVLDVEPITYCKLGKHSTKPVAYILSPKHSSFN